MISLSSLFVSAKLDDVTKKRIVFGLIILVILIMAGFLLWRFVINPQKALLTVETQPVSQVFINGELAGKTPYKGEFEEHEVDLKLVPESFEQALMPYEAKIFLSSGVETIVRREFGAEEGMSQGEEISFEKEGGRKVSLAVVSVPEGASVFIDQKYVDLSPVKHQDIESGIHQITLQAEGYKDRSFSVQLIPGYGLTAFVELAGLPQEQAEDTRENKSEQEESRLVVIKDTPTGFLRVRKEASMQASEVTQVKPGEEYEFLDSVDGWYKIRINEETTGWISQEYAKFKE